jgi:hypothetical protein
VRGIAEVSLASVMARRREPSTALDYYDRAIRGWESVGAWTPQWVTLRTLARLLAELDQTGDAAILYGAATSDRTGSAAYGSDAAMLRELATSLRSRLGNAEFKTRVEEGAAWPTKWWWKARSMRSGALVEPQGLLCPADRTAVHVEED